MRPPRNTNLVDRHRVDRRKLYDPNHVALMSQVVGPLFQIRAHSRPYEKFLHFFVIPYETIWAC